MNKLSLSQVDVLIDELVKYPFLYDETYSSHFKKELHVGVWDNIAAAVCRDQWFGMSLEEKAKKVKDVKQVFQNDQQFFLSRLKQRKSLQSRAEEPQRFEASTSQEQRGEHEVQEKKRRRLSDSSVDENNTNDYCRNILVIFLLPIFKRLTSTDQRQLVVEFYSMIEKRLSTYSLVQTLEGDDGHEGQN